MSYLLNQNEHKKLANIATFLCTLSLLVILLGMMLDTLPRHNTVASENNANGVPASQAMYVAQTK